MQRTKTETLKYAVNSRSILGNTERYVCEAYDLNVFRISSMDFVKVENK